MLLHALANAVNHTVFMISITYLVLRFNGETELLVEILFEFIKEFQPALILMEEIDVVGRRRTDAETDLERRLKSEFLRQLDLILEGEDKIAFVATTNVPGEVDPTFLRRFERRLLCPLPSEADRLALITDRLTGTIELDSSQLRGLAKVSRGFSCCEILNLINEVFIESCKPDSKPVTEASFKRKFKNYNPNVSSKNMSYFVRQLKKIGDSDQIKEIDPDLYESSTCDYIA